MKAPPEPDTLQETIANFVWVSRKNEEIQKHTMLLAAMGWKEPKLNVAMDLLAQAAFPYFRPDSDAAADKAEQLAKKWFSGGPMVIRDGVLEDGQRKKDKAQGKDGRAPGSGQEPTMLLPRSGM